LRWGLSGWSIRERTDQGARHRDHYPAVLRLFKGAAPGRILDVPAGHGAFAKELLEHGHRDIECLDINAEGSGSMIRA